VNKGYIFLQLKNTLSKTYSMNPTLPRMVGYIRGSTLDQQNTLLAQRTQIEHYTAYKQAALAKVFVDEGESAFSVDFYERPVVQQMLLWMKENSAASIVITKLDRGFRNALDCLFTVENLAERKINLHLLDIGLDTTTPVGKLLLTMMAGIAEFENKRRAERQVLGFSVMRRAKQRCGAIPYGWDAVTSDRTSKTGRKADDLVANQTEQIVLQQILVWNHHLSDNEIARRLNAAGIPTKNAGKTMRRTIGKGTPEKHVREFIVAGKWSGASVRSVCANPRLENSKNLISNPIYTRMRNGVDVRLGSCLRRRRQPCHPFL
jgi:site-specific DNA recombinase